MPPMCSGPSLKKMSSINERFELGKPLARYSTYQIGGPADFFFEAKTKGEAVEALNWASEHDLPYFVFGGGSNLLFDDEGFHGLVIKMSANEIRVEGELIYAEAGAKAGALVKAAQEAELTGLEAWNGLPGTVGGAVFGNAGCFGVESKDVLGDAELWLPGEGLKKVGLEFFDYEYRNSKLKKEGGVVLAATFKLQKAERSEIDKKMKEIALLRVQKQPPGLSTGSFFKNPPGDKSAGWLIEQCGLKEAMVGKAQVSKFHANFFMNKGGATAEDVLGLAEKVKAEVKQRFGIELEQEVIYLQSS